MPPDLSGFDPTEDLNLDPTTLRALAHPLRVRMLGLLRLHGPATASKLAQQLGETSGATSYHLRELAKHGLVVEVAELSRGRERWWRAGHRSTRYDLEFDADSDPDVRATGGEYLRAVARIYSDRVLHFADNIEYAGEIYGQDWARVFTLTDSHLALTIEQAAQLNQEINDLVDRYRDLPAEEGSRHLGIQIVLFPQTGFDGEPGSDDA